MLPFWINLITAEYGRNNNELVPSYDCIKFVDQDEAYSGGRMCREGVTEPDRNNSGNYWYNFCSNRKNVDGAKVRFSLKRRFANTKIQDCLIYS